jgi:hypothetical protein
VINFIQQSVMFCLYPAEDPEALRPVLNYLAWQEGNLWKKKQYPELVISKRSAKK